MNVSLDRPATAPADEGDRYKECRGITTACLQSRFGSYLVLVVGQTFCKVRQQLEERDAGIALGVVSPFP
jgi:hypothetical protein